MFLLAFWQAPKSGLVTDASALCWDECLSPAPVTCEALCLYLIALVPNGQLAEAEKKDEAGTCSVLLSLLEITATTVE